MRNPDYVISVSHTPPAGDVALHRISLPVSYPATDRRAACPTEALTCTVYRRL
jgi:hypothetical protein